MVFLLVLQHPPIRPDLGNVAIYYLCISGALNHLNHRLHHSVIHQPVSRIEKHQVLTFGHPDAFVHGIVYSVIPLRDPLQIPPIRILLDNIYTPVTTCPVNNNILEIREGLRNNALHCLLQTGLIVPIYCYNGEYHDCIMTGCYSSIILDIPFL